MFLGRYVRSDFVRDILQNLGIEVGLDLLICTVALIYIIRQAGRASIRSSLALVLGLLSGLAWPMQILGSVRDDFGQMISSHI